MSSHFQGGGSGDGSEQQQDGQYPLSPQGHPLLPVSQESAAANALLSPVNPVILDQYGNDDLVPQGQAVPNSGVDVSFAAAAAAAYDPFGSPVGPAEPSGQAIGRLDAEALALGLPAYLQQTFASAPQTPQLPVLASPSQRPQQPQQHINSPLRLGSGGSVVAHGSGQGSRRSRRSVSSGSGRGGGGAADALNEPSPFQQAQQLARTARLSQGVRATQPLGPTSGAASSSSSRGAVRMLNMDSAGGSSAAAAAAVASGNGPLAANARRAVEEAVFTVRTAAGRDARGQPNRHELSQIAKRADDNMNSADPSMHVPHDVSKNIADWLEAVAAITSGTSWDQVEALFAEVAGRAIAEGRGPPSPAPQPMLQQQPIFPLGPSPEQLLLQQQMQAMLFEQARTQAQAQARAEAAIQTAAEAAAAAAAKEKENEALRAQLDQEHEERVSAQAAKQAAEARLAQVQAERNANAAELQKQLDERDALITNIRAEFNREKTHILAQHHLSDAQKQSKIAEVEGERDEKLAKLRRDAEDQRKRDLAALAEKDNQLQRTAKEAQEALVLAAQLRQEKEAMAAKLAQMEANLRLADGAVERTRREKEAAEARVLANADAAARVEQLKQDLNLTKAEAQTQVRREQEAAAKKVEEAAAKVLDAENAREKLRIALKEERARNPILIDDPVDRIRRYEPLRGGAGAAAVHPLAPVAAAAMSPLGRHRPAPSQSGQPASQRRRYNYNLREEISIASEEEKEEEDGSVTESEGYAAMSEEEEAEDPVDEEDPQERHRRLTLGSWRARVAKWGPLHDSSESRALASNSERLAAFKKLDFEVQFLAALVPQKIAGFKPTSGDLLRVLAMAEADRGFFEKLEYLERVFFGLPRKPEEIVARRAAAAAAAPGRRSARIVTSDKWIWPEGNETLVEAKKFVSLYWQHGVPQHRGGGGGGGAAAAAPRPVVPRHALRPAEDSGDEKSDDDDAILEARALEVPNYASRETRELAARIGHARLPRLEKAPLDHESKNSNGQWTFYGQPAKDFAQLKTWLELMLYILVRKEAIRARVGDPEWADEQEEEWFDMTVAKMRKHHWTEALGLPRRASFTLETLKRILYLLLHSKGFQDWLWTQRALADFASENRSKEARAPLGINGKGQVLEREYAFRLARDRVLDMIQNFDPHRPRVDTRVRLPKSSIYKSDRGVAEYIDREVLIESSRGASAADPAVWGIGEGYQDDVAPMELDNAPAAAPRAKRRPAPAVASASAAHVRRSGRNQRGIIDLVSSSSSSSSSESEHKSSRSSVAPSLVDQDGKLWFDQPFLSLGDVFAGDDARQDQYLDGPLREQAKDPTSWLNKLLLRYNEVDTDFLMQSEDAMLAVWHLWYLEHADEEPFKAHLEGYTKVYLKAELGVRRKKVHSFFGWLLAEERQARAAAAASPVRASSGSARSARTASSSSSSSVASARSRPAAAAGAAAAQVDAQQGPWKRTLAGPVLSFTGHRMTNVERMRAYQDMLRQAVATEGSWVQRLMAGYDKDYLIKILDVQQALWHLFYLQPFAYEPPAAQFHDEMRGVPEEVIAAERALREADLKQFFDWLHSEEGQAEVAAQRQREARAAKLTDDEELGLVPVPSNAVLDARPTPPSRAGSMASARSGAPAAAAMADVDEDALTEVEEDPSAKPASASAAAAAAPRAPSARTASTASSAAPVAAVAHPANMPRTKKLEISPDAGQRENFVHTQVAQAGKSKWWMTKLGPELDWAYLRSLDRVVDNLWHLYYLQPNWRPQFQMGTKAPTEELNAELARRETWMRTELERLIANRPRRSARNTSPAARAAPLRGRLDSAAAALKCKQCSKPVSSTTVIDCGCSGFFCSNSCAISIPSYAHDSSRCKQLKK